MSNMPPAILLLGGTGDARELASRLTTRYPSIPVFHSLAGVTDAVTPLTGTVRRGGFGGIDGMVDFIRSHAIRLLVDATHPYAATIGGHAVAAAEQSNIPLIRLERPPWRPEAGDRWYMTSSGETAAAQAQSLGSRIFVSLGRQGIAPFEALSDCWILWRVVRAPDRQPFRNGLTLTARGPFHLDAEQALLVHHKIQVLVSRNSGGEDTYAKIIAARRLQIPVVMIERPPRTNRPAANVTTSVELTLSAIENHDVFRFLNRC